MGKCQRLKQTQNKPNERTNLWSQFFELYSPRVHRFGNELIPFQSPVQIMFVPFCCFLLLFALYLMIYKFSVIAIREFSTLTHFRRSQKIFSFYVDFFFIILKNRQCWNEITKKRNFKLCLLLKLTIQTINEI